MTKPLIGIIAFMLAILSFILIDTLPTYIGMTQAEILYFFPILMIFVGIYAVMKD